MLACLLLLHITAYDNINVSADGALTSPWTDLAASEFPTWPIACAQITASKWIWAHGRTRGRPRECGYT